MPKKKPSDDFEEYCNSRFGLPKLPSPRKKPTIADLVAEGNELLKKDDLNNIIKKLTTKSKKSDTEVLNTKNPYVKARNQILSDIDSMKRTRLLKMEETNNIDNKEYNEFIRMIRILGDKFSEN